MDTRIFMGIFGAVVGSAFVTFAFSRKGLSIAFYFHDPEGNLIEVYWSTGVQCPQPCGEAIDLSKPDVELLEQLKALIGRKGFPSSTDQKV